jgi:NAD(P)-dependent dehydrogenase (short-subunit alcohol dehydrogenase family)
LFACAGGSRHGGPIIASDADAWRATVDLNLVGTFLCIKHAAKLMMQNGGGSIIGMSSIAGHTTHRFMSAYCASKAGIEMLVKCAADELGEYGIRVNGVQPGIVDTELMSFITAGGPVLESYYANMPVARVGTVADVAAVVAFLAGPESTWITGQMIGIDGGHQLRRGPDYSFFAET